jgi:hypothetical protein
MSAAGKAKAKASASASGGKRGAPPKDPADAPLPSDKRRRERGGMDDSDHEFDRCLAPLLTPSASLLFFPFGGSARPGREVRSNREVMKRGVFVIPARREFRSVSAGFPSCFGGGGISCE